MAESGYDPALANLHCISHNGFDRADCKLERMLARKAAFQAKSAHGAINHLKITGGKGIDRNQ
jgi:hypothetical protein